MPSEKILSMIATLRELEQRYVDKLEKISRTECLERTHILYDYALCDLLSELGFDRVVKQFDSIDKWYATEKEENCKKV